MTMPATQAYVHNYALVVSRVMTEFARKRFNLGEDWVPVVRPDFNPKRKRSWGGRRNVGGMGKRMVPFMSLVLSRYTGENAHTTFSEYKRFEKDPVIGTYEGTSWEMALAALIAHEISHAVQYTVKDEDIIKELGGYGRGHGEFWRNIYAIFRKRFVNHGNIPVASFLYAGPEADAAERGNYSFARPIE